MTRDRKIIWGLIILVVIILLLIGLIPKKKEAPEISLQKEKQVLYPKEEVKAVSVFSTQSDTQKAVEEIITKIKQGFKEKSPQFIFLFSTVGYDYEKIIKEIKNTWPKVKIYGGTSCLAVQTEKGFHQAEKSLAGLAITSEKIKFGVAGVNIKEFDSPKEAGKKAIELALNDAKVSGEKPKVVLITGSVGHEEELISGIEEVIGKDVPIIGGSAGDNDITGKWKQFANDKVFSSGVALAVLFTDLKVAISYEAGYFLTTEKGIITKAKGRTIYEINNQPAAEVYNKWTEGVIKEELEKGGSVLSKTTFYPLAKVLKGREGQTYYLSIHPLSVNLPEKSLTVFTNVKEGDEISLMKGNWEILLNRALNTPSVLLEKEKIEPNEPYFALYTFCAGTMLAIPEKERLKMPLLLKQGLGNIPFIGTFTFGEQGYLPGVGNVHGNLVNSIVVVAPYK